MSITDDFNAVTILDIYPLLRMDDYIDSLGEASVFTTMDCNSGYWQIPIREEDRDKTALHLTRVLSASFECLLA